MPPDLDPRLVGRRVLVAGGAGYVGSVLVPALVGAGAAVTVLDDLVYGHGAAVAHLVEVPRVAFVRADLGDVDAVHRALGGSDDVVLLAALVGDPICRRYPDEAIRVNRDAGAALFDAAATAGPRRFVVASTCSNYGVTGTRPADETAPLHPQSLYARTKVDLEGHVLAAGAQRGMTTTVLRFATAHGLSPRMRFDLTVAQFTRVLAAGQPLEVYDADTWRPYCHVRDMAAAVVAVLASPAAAVHRQVFNVGSDDQQFTKRMVVDEITRHLDRGRVEYRSGDVDPRDYRVAFGKIADTLAFRPRHTVEASVPVLLGALRAGLFRGADRRPDDFANRTLVDQPAPAPGR